MNRIVVFVKTIVQKESPTQLGRWGVEVCSKRMNYKIDSANEDHCGPCGQYGKVDIDTKISYKQTHNTGLKIKPMNHVEYE